MQRDTLIIGGICVMVMIIGVLLYIFAGHTSPTAILDEVQFVTIQKGNHAVSVDERKNYRVKTQEELSELWKRAYDLNGPALPVVDFETHQVLAVFDGSHSTGGYDVRVDKVIDDGLNRTVIITHIIPDESCVVSESLTSPFEFVMVPKSEASIKREDTEEMRICS